MENKEQSSRRNFLVKLATTSAAVAVGTNLLAAESKNSVTNYLKRDFALKKNRTVNLALIGAGGMGTTDTKLALGIPGFKLIAVCDLYDGRLKAAKERWGEDLFITKDYQEILKRKDIDAVIIGTPDHWHKQISIDALSAGKHVYCEKPMVHSIDEGPAVIKAQKSSGKVFQVGSQGLASLGNEKAKALLMEGAIGKLIYAEGFWARNSPIGAWQYPIPADGNVQTIDWDRYIANTKKRPFDPLRFFRWRNYADYGTGMAGDLFVHLFSSLHFITNSLGPNRIYATGGLRYWKDGRECPDVLLGTFDYPESEAHPAFNLSLRCNFVDGTSGTTYLKLVGTEGAMDVNWDDVVVKRNPPYVSDDPFYLEQMRKAGTPIDTARKKILPPQEIKYQVEKGYKGAHYDHILNFYDAIINGKNVIEDAIFGYRAAAPALLCNESYSKGKPMHWDPERMQVINIQ